jgi:hypothetical protein
VAQAARVSTKAGLILKGLFNIQELFVLRTDNNVAEIIWIEEVASLSTEFSVATIQPTNLGSSGRNKVAFVKMNSCFQNHPMVDRIAV